MLLGIARQPGRSAETKLTRKRLALRFLSQPTRRIHLDSPQPPITRASMADPVSPPARVRSPGPHTVTAVFGGVNANFMVTNPTTTLTITKEDARATYTAALFASTACVTCSTANVTLSATVQDMSAIPADPATDATEGDIRN